MKRALGKLDPPLPDLLERLETTDVRWLPVTARHADAVGALPLHHRDPFDRLLVAQARAEGLPIVSVDPWVAAYDVEVLR
ncbi:MAG: type II toxin-antitoxin system VapC family toxin [Solirubrobacteraceae bacterium]